MEKSIKYLILQPYHGLGNEPGNNLHKVFFRVRKMEQLLKDKNLKIK